MQGAFQASETFCPAERRRYALLAAIVASAMAFIDGSVVSLAIPAMRQSLDASLTEAQWINNAYLLPLSALMLVGGASGDRFGLRRVFGYGILGFIAASILCAIAPTAETLIAARVLQGIAAAFMVPGSLALISKVYPPGERGRAIGIWAASSALTTAVGPILGGLLLSLGSVELWRLVFAVNLPVGALALYWLWGRVPPDEGEPSGPLDVLGAALAAFSLGTLAWALTGPEGEGSGPGVEHLTLYGVVGLGLLGAFLLAETRAAQPMMPLRLFSVRSFSAANLVTFALYFALAAVMFYLPTTLIAGWGVSPGLVGVMFMPLTAAIALGSGPAGRMAERFGPGPLIGIGCGIVALSYAALAAWIGMQSFWGQVMPAMIAMGIGMAFVVAPLSAAVMGSVDEGDSGAASGINNAVSRMAALIAVAALGGLVAAGYAEAGGTATFGIPDPAPDHGAASGVAFARVAWLAAALCAASSALAFWGLRRVET
ncbi:MAG: MFS transporter [Pseudomonadota bacterium]